MDDLYKGMIRALGELNINEKEGAVAVETAERETDSEKTIILRIAFQDNFGLHEIEFFNKAQVETVARALIHYLDCSISKLLK